MAVIRDLLGKYDRPIQSYLSWLKVYAVYLLLHCRKPYWADLFNSKDRSMAIYLFSAIQGGNQ